RLIERDEPGFWESLGYNNHGDPWKEERYSGDYLMKRPLAWQIATVKSLRSETPEVKTLTLALPDWTAHRPGQHYDVRLTAEDGYSAQRSYSVASEPERAGEIDITVERIGDGEVAADGLERVGLPADRIRTERFGPSGA